MYADKMTDSMTEAIDETERRRAKQVAYNAAQRHRSAGRLRKKDRRHPRSGSYREG